MMIQKPNKLSNCVRDANRGGFYVHVFRFSRCPLLFILYHLYTFGIQHLHISWHN